MIEIEKKQLYEEREKRFLDAVNLTVPDRVPVICLGTYWYVTQMEDITTLDTLTDNEKFMKVQTNYLEKYQPDICYLHSQIGDPLMYVFYMPMQINLPGVDTPDPNEQVQVLENTVSMKVEDYDYAIEKGYTQLILKYLPKLRPNISNVREKFKKGMEDPASTKIALSNIKRLKEWGYPVYFGEFVESPFSCLSFIRSYKNFCLDLFRIPEKVSETIQKWIPEFCNQTIKGCKELGIPRAYVGMHRENTSFFSVKQWKEFCLPEIKEIVKRHSEEGLLTTLHCDGNWTPVLKYLRELPKGKCIIEIDEDTDPFKAKEIIGDRQCISTGPQEERMMNDSPKEIEAYARELIDRVGRGGGFILKSETSMNTNPKNIQALINTAKASYY